MSHDSEDLVRASRVLNETLALLQSEHKRLEHQYRGQIYEGAQGAGGPVQTLHGINDLVTGVHDQLASIALCAGYTSLGLEEPADRARARAHSQPGSVHEKEQQFDVGWGGALDLGAHRSVHQN
ncbi:hypothetical protein OG357_38700 (plasmid) [Streptomyces sp. NBC_01255]|uniref:hypothetical protein n=1 Tax=Streptomyces sp. NBC_01255 TaxID=2903798 RepID=UPI002E319439|nr:hypothetical protein [Streptomyces sp. NBC_01255]